MPIIKVTAQELGKELTARNKGIRKQTQKAMMRSALRGRAMLTRRTPKDLGQAKAGWTVSKPVIGTVGLSIDLYNNVPYVGILELGARPHKVSREGWLAIYQWVRRHFTYSTKITKGKNKGNQGKQRMMDQGDPVLTDITNAIVYKIGKFGHKPKYFVKLSMPELQAKMGKEISVHLNRYAGKRAARHASSVKVGDIIQ